jgi:hypothetical protein
MSIKNSKNLTLYFLVGGIGGTIIGNIIGSYVNGLSFLKYAYKIGTSVPLVLDLNVLSITFGINFSINIMTIIGVILAIMLYRKH